MGLKLLPQQKEWTGLSQARSDGLLDTRHEEFRDRERKIQDAIRKDDGVVSIVKLTPNRRSKGIALGVY